MKELKVIVVPRYHLPRLDLDVPYVVISVTDPPPAGEPARIRTMATPPRNPDERLYL